MSKSMPSRLVEAELRSLGDHLLLARSLDDERREAAAEVFREIPDLLRETKLPGNTMGPREQEAFAGGYTKRLHAYKEKLGKLLE